MLFLFFGSNAQYFEEAKKAPLKCRMGWRGYPWGGHLTEAAQPQAWLSQGYPRQDPLKFYQAPFLFHRVN
jgi:hypothetical protein